MACLGEPSLVFSTIWRGGEYNPKMLGMSVERIGALCYMRVAYCYTREAAAARGAS